MHVFVAQMLVRIPDPIPITLVRGLLGLRAGARPDEAVSWGKIRHDATPVKVCACACVWLGGGAGHGARGQR